MTTINVSEEDRNPTIEEKYNLHIGRPYRFEMETVVYEGIMIEYQIKTDERDKISPIRVVLKDGFCFLADNAHREARFSLEVLTDDELARVKRFSLLPNGRRFPEAKDRSNEEKR